MERSQGGIPSPGANEETNDKMVGGTSHETSNAERSVKITGDGNKLWSKQLEKSNLVKPRSNSVSGAWWAMIEERVEGVSHDVSDGTTDRASN